MYVNHFESNITKRGEIYFTSILEKEKKRKREREKDDCDYLLQIRRGLMSKQFEVFTLSSSKLLVLHHNFLQYPRD
jgi:hypothetical protein